MNFRRLLPLVALLGAAPLLAQQIGQLPRTTPTTGLADSALFMCTDSTKAVTRACKFSLVQQRLAFKPWDSLVTTSKLRITGASIVGAGTWSNAQTFAAGQLVDSATGAARSQTLTTSRNLWGVAFDGSANVTTAPAFTAGATVSSGQTLTLTGATVTGLPIFSSLTASRAVFTDASKGLVSTATTGSGNVVLSAGPTFTGAITAATLNTSAAITTTLAAQGIGTTQTVGALTGFVYNLITNNTSNSLRVGNEGTTGAELCGNAPSYASIFCAFGSAGKSVVLGTNGTGRVFVTDTTVTTGSHLYLSALTSEPSTKNTLCIDGTTHQVYENAAASCTVSAQRFKKNIGTVSSKMAWDIIRRVPVDSFAYRSGGRRAFGTLADTLAVIDERLVTRNADGQVNSVNYEQLAMLTLGVVQDQQRQLQNQQRQLDSIKAVLRHAKPR